MIRILNGQEVEMSAEEIAALTRMQSAQSAVPSPELVSARQFKLQLLAQDLLDEVEAWVASQPRAIQIAFEYSGSFVKSEPMMQEGFTAMGFTSEQIDDFFAAASRL
ncbi:hypothetical protein FBZ99_101821 [Rhizobium sp. ERR 1071]|uniref:hypothetical protein n=1 Tax=Rhizobium sp. ERR 1071 TaxID=2572677 RepID=UPI00119A5F46|nr:hypothetical protein [Rhizobium sp. ERR1071]TWB20030.1 hypothetical protein FBZ99_101821 [Rhizobium sp. ERR1071]